MEPRSDGRARALAALDRIQEHMLHVADRIAASDYGFPQDAAELAERLNDLDNGAIVLQHMVQAYGPADNI